MVKTLKCIAVGIMLLSTTACEDKSDAPVAVQTSATMQPNQLTIASWNIANLAQAPGVELRGGYARSEDDMEATREIIAGLDADIIAFQEIGSKPALAQVLDTAVYDIAFETRCLTNTKRCEADDGDIYTAIAWKRALDAKPFQIDSLAIGHTNDCGVTRKVRGGVGVNVKVKGNTDGRPQTLHVPSLHMKASCKDDKIEDGTADDCATQKQQYLALQDWMKTVPSSDGIILAGDFNRKLLNSKDSIAKTIFATQSEAILPVADNRTCWASEDYRINFGAIKAQAFKNIPELDKQGLDPWIYSPQYNSSVDFIIHSGLPDRTRISSDQIEMQGYYSFKNPQGTIKACDGSVKATDKKNGTLVFAEALPSDHCPIKATFDFSAQSQP